MTSDWIIRPELFLRYLREDRGLRGSALRLPRRAVLVFGSDDHETFRRALGGRRTPWNASIAVGRVGSRAAAVVRSTIGAPAAALVLEECIVLGVREVLTFGACGSLLEDLRIGHAVLPSRALSEEGTSRHYGGGRWSSPDPGLTNEIRSACRAHGLPAREGGVWTTDAPYRESRSRARAYARRGVVGVEMEASATYAVARQRAVRAGSLFVVSDELGGPDWNAGFHSPAFRRGKGRAIRVLLSVLGRRGG